MVKFKSSRPIHRIVILNSKGGSGKSTLAFNVAGFLAATGRRVALVDMDRQGSSAEWLRKRPDDSPHIRSIHAPYDKRADSQVEQSIVIPDDIDHVVVDVPAGIAADELSDFTCGAHAILIPVLPSNFDIHAASRLVADLLLVALVSRRNGRLGIVANRVKFRTIAYRRLKRFLDSLSIAVVGTLRDTQNYVHAAADGRCIHEMPPSLVRADLEQWQALTSWLEARLATPLTSRDWLRPERQDRPDPQPASRWRQAMLLPAAAAVVAAIGISAWIWAGAPGEPAASSLPTQLTGDDAGDPLAGGSASQSARQDSTLTGVVAQATGSTAQAGIASEPETAVSVDDAADDPRDRFKQTWQLSGVAHAEGASIVLLNNRDDHTTHRIGTEAELDGWIVKDAGPNYAVFAQDGNEVRLVLNEELAN